MSGRVRNDRFAAPHLRVELHEPVAVLLHGEVGPLPEERNGRDPQRESAAAQDAGLVVSGLRTTRCRMEFYDVGSVVWILRKCVWWRKCSINSNADAGPTCCAK